MQIIIDGKTYDANAGEKLLDVARRYRIEIPTLCHSDALPGMASCRLCMVEVSQNGSKQKVAACTYPVSEGMEVSTDTEALIQNRKVLLQMYYLMAPESKRIKSLLSYYHVPVFDRLPADHNNKCVLCGLCTKACGELGSDAISTLNRGTEKKIGTAFDEPSLSCIGCGSCASVCPTGAIEMTEVDGKRTIWGKTFQLLPCSDCGGYYTTPEALAHIQGKLGENAGNIEELQLCERCKAKRTAGKLKDGLHLEGIFDTLKK